MRPVLRPAVTSAALALLFTLGSCLEPGERWEHGERPPETGCTPGRVACQGERLQRCEAETGTLGRWVTVDDCAAGGLTCVAELERCLTCRPGSTRCEGQTVLLCDARGGAFTRARDCAGTATSVCRGGACTNLCADAALEHSNVGCEYWAVDLDNANVGVNSNAAAQQFAVVLSNPQLDVSAQVTIEQDDAPVGAPSAPYVVARATVPPMGLRVFKLGPREVDGSAPGTFDTGTHTAHTRSAFRVASDVPLIAYQFNPLENVNVFSNDASLLKPTEALGDPQGRLSPAYVVLGWPQTIASTDDPDTNFDPRSPTDLRAFLTIVGTRAGTRVRVTPTTRALGSGGAGGVPETLPGQALERTLGPFEVLNLETDDFLADFTGTLIESTAPVAVFSGSEASDAPHFERLLERRCCADHLEEQLDPIRTAGTSFVASVSSNRSAAVKAAGGAIEEVPQVEYFRVIAVTPEGARVHTTAREEDRAFTLSGRGSYRELVSDRAFTLTASAPVMLAAISPSQDAAGVPRGLPGGDPSLLILPPVQQFRTRYVFLTPDKYAFDFIRIIAAHDTRIVIDGAPLEGLAGCVTLPGDGLTARERGAPEPPWVVHRCQLSFPVIDPLLPAPSNVLPGSQDDGVHRLEASAPVGVIVDGFDSYVSYAYAAGTELKELLPPQ